MMYATRLRGDPGETYRAVDVASRAGGASPHELIMMLYEDLLRELRVAALATEKRDYATKSAKLTKALAILFALEAGLDFNAGGEVAETLSRFYRGARETIMRASLDHDPALLLDVAANVSEIADSWRMIGQRG
ncbi:MAG: flagellar export chaperone FliS [Sphingomonas sp. SCN 67-18]|nr:MAG: flagellar export chaperone FliS [Sphingomonas sp. SCN 67-18]